MSTSHLRHCVCDWPEPYSIVAQYLSTRSASTCCPVPLYLQFLPVLPRTKFKTMLPRTIIFENPHFYPLFQNLPRTIVHLHHHFHQPPAASQWTMLPRSIWIWLPRTSLLVPTTVSKAVGNVAPYYLFSICFIYRCTLFFV